MNIGADGLSHILKEKPRNAGRDPGKDALHTPDSRGLNNVLFEKQQTNSLWEEVAVTLFLRSDTCGGKKRVLWSVTLTMLWCYSIVIWTQPVHAPSC